MPNTISLIVSVYNEEKGLGHFYETAKPIMENLRAGDKNSGLSCVDYEICFVNDGSTDNSLNVLEDIKAKDPEHVTLINFSKNFGHEAAMTAGLDYARGDILIFIDADLQHPPALIPEIAAKFAEGYDIVSMARTKNESAGNIKNLTSGFFYWIINRVSDADVIPGASDFFAINNRVAKVLRQNYREKVRFMRGFVQNIGFKKTMISYEASERYAGSSHYSLGKLLKFSIDTIICFSDMPLKLGIYTGFLAGMLGLALIIYTFLTRGGAPSGYATIVIVLCFMSAMLFMLLGIIGEYISILFREIKDKPIYIIDNIKAAKPDESSESP